MPASITLTVAHLPTSTSFFLACLQPLNYVYRGRVNDTIGFGLPDAAPDFWITQSIPGVPPGPAHVAFPATSREIVHKFFLAAIKAGGKCHGEPALRDIQSGYYSAAVIDLDNNSIEAVYRPDLMGAQERSTTGSKSMVSSARKSVATTVAPSKAPSTTKTRSVVSQAQISAASQAPRSTISRAPSNAPKSETSRASVQTVPHVSPSPPTSSGSISDFLAEAKGSINVARELVSSMSSGKEKSPTTPKSHEPSDAIVGTLLGVAAGAALHYAFSNRTKSQDSNTIPEPPRQGIARSETAPSLTQQRYNYYYDYANTRPQLALEDASSAYSRGSHQRYIEMADNDPSISEYAPSTIRPVRRNSFSGPVPSQASTTRTTATRREKLLEAPPPTSYRAPTAVTNPDGRSQVSHKTSSRSRSSSLTRTQSRSSRSSAKQDEGYASASESRSRASRQSATATSKSKHSRSEPSTRRSSVSPEQTISLRQNIGSTVGSVVTAIKNHVEPPRTAPSHHDNNNSNSSNNEETQSFYSTKTSTTKEGKRAKPQSNISSRRRDRDSHQPSRQRQTQSEVVVGKLTKAQLDKLSDNGRPRTDITKSIIGKVKDMDGLDVTNREVGPEDSVSQVSSNPSRRSRR